MTEEEIPDHFIPSGVKLEKNRIVIYDPESHSFKKGDAKIFWTTSKGRYLNDEGIECELFMGIPEQFCFGVNYIYPLGTNEKNKTPDNRVGLQICYPITNIKTIDNPTEEEQILKYNLDLLAECTWEKLEEECKKNKKQRKIPNPSYNSYLGATAGKTVDKSYAIKPIYSYPLVSEKEAKDPDNREEDRTKPQRAFFKLLSSGKGRTLKSLSIVHGPGDESVSAEKYIDVRGRIVGVVKFDGCFWGAHGQNATYGGSVRFKLTEMNYTPQGTGAPHRRMLPRNTASAIEEVVDEDNDETQEEECKGNKKDEEFPNPGDDDDPMSMLGQDEDKSKKGKKVIKTKNSAAKKREILLKKKKIHHDEES